MKKRGGCHAASQRTGYLQVVGVDAIRDGRQEQHAGAVPVSLLAAALADHLDFVIIGAVRQVQIMGFRGSEGKNSDLPTLLSDKAMVLLRQLPLAHGTPHRSPVAPR